MLVHYLNKYNVHIEDLLVARVVVSPSYVLKSLVTVMLNSRSERDAFLSFVRSGWPFEKERKVRREATTKKRITNRRGGNQYDLLISSDCPKRDGTSEATEMRS